MALISPSKTIAELQKEITPDGLRAAIVIVLTEWLLSFNVANTMKGSQIGECVDLLILEFPNYKLEDFKVCLTYSKTSRYGKVYNRIDTPVVFDMFREYDKERKDILASAQVKQHGEIKQLEAGTARTGWTPERLAGLKDLAKQISPEKDKIKTFTPLKPSEQQQRDNRWLRMFDKLQQKWPVSTYNGMPLNGRFLKRYHLVLTPSDFLRYKLKQTQIVTEYLAKKTIL